MTEELLRATVSVRGVLVTARGETLVVQRSTDGEWELPGGRIGPEENVEAGLEREFAEETALEIVIGETVHANSWRNDNDDGRFAVYYRCRADEWLVQLSEEHNSFRWVEYDEAESMLPDPQATAVREARPEGGSGREGVLQPPATSD